MMNSKSNQKLCSNILLMNFMKRPVLSSAKMVCITGLLLSGNVFSACDFDTDDADSPNFMDRIIDCEEQSKALEIPHSQHNRQPQYSTEMAPLTHCQAWRNDPLWRRVQ